jgi:glycosyltransferase involved in cell wall biosynthesis
VLRGNDERATAPRVGIYVENLYRLDGDRITTIQEGYAFTLFATELRHHARSLVVFGREAPAGVAADHPLPAGVELVQLPYYPSLRDLPRLAAALAGTVAGVWRGLSRVDAMWVFGPHPIALVVAVLALARRKQVVLAVRQDTLEYFRSRLPGRGWAPALLLVRGLDLAWRALARTVPLTAVGEELARRYRGEAITVSLVRDEDVAEAPAERSWEHVRLLAVGRIDREKNPLLLVDALAGLERAAPGRFSVTAAGDGPLTDAVRARAAELGVDVELLGFVPYGPELERLYRDAHMFVHVSLTEGAPAAVVEALAAGLPVVATAVGGVPALVGGGRGAVLVPPSDRRALEDAIRRVADDAELRARLFEQGRQLALAVTVDAQIARVAALLGDVGRS